MAEEIRKVISVDVSGAVDSLDEMRKSVEESGYSFKSLGDAKKYIDMLRASLIDLEEESDEYVERVEEIDKVQEKLNKAMKATGSSLKNAEGSYNALAKKMSELKKRFKETNDEAERKSLAKQIVGINNELKGMDASIGNFQRNVGNYEASFTKGLSGIASKLEALGNPLAIAKNGVLALGNAFKALIANPVGAAIMLIVGALAALKKGFAGSEDASNSLKRAFSALQPVINVINNVFTGFAKIVGGIAEKAIPALVNALQKAGEWMMKLLNNLGLVSDERLASFQKSIEAQKAAIKVSQDLTNREIDLTKKKREYQVNEAKAEMEVAELRAKAADKEKYSAKEREKFLEQAIAKEKSINDQKMALVQEEYDILKQRSELTDNTAADNDELAAAEARLYNAKREHFEKEKSLLKEKQRAGKELSDAENKRLEELKRIEAEEAELRKKEEEKILEIQDRAYLSLLSDRDRELEILRRKYEEEKALLEKYEKDTTALTEEYENKKLDIIAKTGGDKVKEIQERAAQSLMSNSDREISILNKKYAEEKKLLEEHNESTINLTLEYNKRISEIRSAEGEGKVKDIDSEAALQRDIADKTIQIEYDKKMKLLSIERERLEGTKKIYQELFALDDLSEEKKEEYANKIKEINAGLEENSYQLKEVQKEQVLDLVNTYSQVVDGIGELMGNVAEIWQESIKERAKNGKITEEQAKKEFEDSKKLQIATAIINGLAGVATAVATAMSLGPIAGPIMAAVNSALVITTTALQVAKIKSTTFDGGGASVSSDVAAAPTTAATEYVPNYSTNITGESENVNLANAVSSGVSDQRVYVVESDINQVGKRVEVRENESTF